MSALKRPGIWDKKARSSVTEQGSQLTEESTGESTNGLTDKSISELTGKLTNQSTDGSIIKSTNKLIKKSIKKLTNESTSKSTGGSTGSTDTEDQDSEVFLSQLKRPENDRKIVGFHLPGDVRRALKRLKADDYEMSEVVAQLLRKHLPKKYFE